MLCSGKGVVGAFTYTPTPLTPLQLPTQGTASMTTKPFPCFCPLLFFFFSLTTKPEVSCIPQQLFRPYLWQHIRCISPAVSIRGVFITLHCVTTELVCEGNTHINNLGDRFRQNLLLTVVWTVAGLLPQWAPGWEIRSLNVRAAISLISFFFYYIQRTRVDSNNDRVLFTAKRSYLLKEVNCFQVTHLAFLIKASTKNQFLLSFPAEGVWCCT